MLICAILGLSTFCIWSWVSKPISVSKRIAWNQFNSSALCVQKVRCLYHLLCVCVPQMHHTHTTFLSLRFARFLLLNSLFLFGFFLIRCVSVCPNSAWLSSEVMARANIQSSPAFAQRAIRTSSRLHTHLYCLLLLLLLPVAECAIRVLMRDILFSFVHVQYDHLPDWQRVLSVCRASFATLLTTKDERARLPFL